MKADPKYGRFTKDFIEKTQEIWGKIYGRPISESEAQTIAENVIRYFKGLTELNKVKESKYEKALHND